MELRELIVSREKLLHKRAGSAKRTFFSTLTIGLSLLIAWYCWPRADAAAIEVASKLRLAGQGILTAGFIVTGIAALRNIKLARQIYALTVMQAVADLKRPDLRDKE